MSYTLHTDIKAKPVSYGETRNAITIKYIVIHYTGNSTDKAVSNAKYFRDSNARSAGAHYFVDDTDVYQSVDDNRIAWAVGGSKYSDCAKTGGGKMYGKITNTNSISIEMCSTGGRISDKTVDNTVELTKKLMKKYGISAKNVYRHFDVTGKSCPGWSGWIGKDDSKWKAFKKNMASTAISTTKKTYTGTFPTLPSRGYFKKGDKGTQVKNLQKFLNWYGDNKLTVDGVFGSNTYVAVRNFQSKENLVVDGQFGKKSLEKAKAIKK